MPCRGLGPYALQLFMGHSNLDTVTPEYYVDQEKIDAAGEAMEAMFPRPALPQPGDKQVACLRRRRGSRGAAIAISRATEISYRNHAPEGSNP